MNNYISINLNNIEKSDNIYDLNHLIDKYYNIESYNFNNNINKDDIFCKFNLDYDDYINYNSNNILNNNQGIISFNLSMVIDEKLQSNINLILNNYKDISLNKYYDNYIIYFNNKESNYNSFNNLNHQFYNDIKDLLLYDKIKNIKNIINNERFDYKIKDDINFLDNYYNNQINKSYNRSIILDIEKNNYTVNYVFTNDIKVINSNLKKYQDYNNYLNDIIDEIYGNKLDSDNLLVESIFDPQNLYNKLNNKYNLILTMEDVFNKDMIINCDKKNEYPNYDKFLSNIIVFINELTKRKIQKIIKLFNYKIIKQFDSIE
jgi:hypothetical protein